MRHRAVCRVPRHVRRRWCRRRAGRPRPRSRSSRRARRDPPRRGSGERSPAGTCTPCRPAAPVRAAARSGRTRARRTASGAPRGCVISRIASRPPGRRTRRSSRRPASRSATLRTPKPTVAASKLASANGSASASPSTHSIVSDLRRARASISAEKSRPVTMPPSRSAAIARSPVPQQASRTRNARLHDRLDREPPPPPVEPDRHDAVHDVVDRRDPVEHPPHAFRLERPRLVCHEPIRPSVLISVLSIPIWSSARATTKSTRSSIVSAPW